MRLRTPGVLDQRVVFNVRVIRGTAGGIYNNYVNYSKLMISPFSKLVMTSNFQQVSLYLINFQVEEQVEE